MSAPNEPTGALALDLEVVNRLWRAIADERAVIGHHSCERDAAEWLRSTDLTDAALHTVDAKLRERDAEIALLRAEIRNLNEVMRESPTERELEAAYRAGQNAERPQP